MELECTLQKTPFLDISKYIFLFMVILFHVLRACFCNLFGKHKVRHDTKFLNLIFLQTDKGFLGNYVIVSFVQ